MVLIRNSQKLLKIKTAPIKRIAGDLLIFSGLQGRDISILFVDNKKIQTFNKEYFGKDKPTNVISFSYMEPPVSVSGNEHGDLQEKHGPAAHSESAIDIPFPDPGVMGDIIVSLERAREEAISAGISFYERLFALIIHGLLHIVGFDHEREAGERRRMQYREKQLLRFVCNHPVYQTLPPEMVPEG